MMDYKDAKWTASPAGFTDANGAVPPPEEARFLSSIYDLGDGEIDFPGCHRVLKANRLSRMELCRSGCGPARSAC
jgi:hypothetical protein